MHVPRDHAGSICASDRHDENPARVDSQHEHIAYAPLQQTSLRSRGGRILVVDDEPSIRGALVELLRGDGYMVESAADGLDALPKIEAFGPDLVLTDLQMPGMGGLALMRKARSLDPDACVIVMTACVEVDTAVAAIREGAADCLTKPTPLNALTMSIERSLERRRLFMETRLLRQRLMARDRIQHIVGSSPAMCKIFETLLQVAPSRASVLITGESGTGKELIAAALHEHSNRASAPFVKLHCAALPEPLLESELFGYEASAGSAAAARRDGRLQQADGGTLLLDEVAELGPAVQARLLRFLRERAFERVGGSETLEVDVRVVAATSRDLMQEVKAGRFLEDLFYLLNVVSIVMPPLRSRASDVSLLAHRFVQKYAAENAKSIRGFSEEALDCLNDYAWPGNVRELENAIERAVVICRGDEIRLGDLPPLLAGRSAPRGDVGMPQVPGAQLADLERYAIMKTLEHTRGSTARAAEMLGISPRTIQYRLHEYASSTRKSAQEPAQLATTHRPNKSRRRVSDTR